MTVRPRFCTFCGKSATLVPKMLLYASTLYGKHPPAQMFAALPMCQPCTEGKKVSDFMKLSAFALLADGFHQQGKARPVYERTKLSFIPIDDPEVVEFLRTAKLPASTPPS